MALHAEKRDYCSPADVNLAAIACDPSVIYLVSPELELRYVNAAWRKFAVQNGDDPDVSPSLRIGSSLADVIVGPLRSMYLETFRALLKSRDVWHHDYECSSSERYRLYRQTVYPLAAGGGLMFVNTLVEERPHDLLMRPPKAPDPRRYRHDNGFFAQCSLCRRYRRAREPQAWDWVPAWVERPPRETSHGFCIPCLEFWTRQLPPMLTG